LRDVLCHLAETEREIERETEREREKESDGERERVTLEITASKALLFHNNICKGRNMSITFNIILYEV
jgi:hypothetical protein